MLHNYDFYGYLSWYNDSLLARGSVDQIFLGTRFSAPVQTGLEAHPVSCTTVPEPIPVGKAVRAWR